MNDTLLKKEIKQEGKLLDKQRKKEREEENKMNKESKDFNLNKNDIIRTYFCEICGICECPKCGKCEKHHKVKCLKEK